VTAGTLPWFAQHEFRLGWRDFVSMMTAGRRWKLRSVVIVLVLFGAFMHLVADFMVGRHADAWMAPDAMTLTVITGCALLSWSLMLSQAMESVTRAFYARSDLDLILSSPVAASRVFAIRIATMGLAVAAMAMGIASPFINVLALRGGAQWLAAYGVFAAMGATAAAIAVALTIALFRLIGPKRTRLIAQIVAAVIGAAFVIGLQIAAIFSTGSLSRIAALQSQMVLSHAPALDSWFWIPARAILGDGGALVITLAAGFLMLGAAIAIFAPRFGFHAVAASGVSASTTRQMRSSGFRSASAARTLRNKEWTLLLRDPWLVSQTLMQLLYLLPPALLLWRGFSDGTSALVLLVPVLVMAAGQLAGGLAWLAISGEDAPDLVATAPVNQSLIMRAKIEAVIGAIAIVFAPFVLALAIASPFHAAIAGIGVMIAAASATTIQFWFRAQAKRSHFRRRQTSSRVATFAEAFSSIGWAASAGFAAVSLWGALICVTLTLGVLFGARFIAPPPQR
jgi:ABC-2 type transport system permease protein